jgi:hypothetical protein
MTQRPALFVAYVGPAGYLPDSIFGPYQCDTRRELVATVDSVLAALDLSARARRGVDLVQAWRKIQRQGNGAAGFTLEDATTRTRVHFHNLTPAELASWDDGEG